MVRGKVWDPFKRKIFRSTIVKFWVCIWSCFQEVRHEMELQGDLHVAANSATRSPKESSAFEPALLKNMLISLSEVLGVQTARLYLKSPC